MTVQAVAEQEWTRISAKAGEFPWHIKPVLSKKHKAVGVPFIVCARLDLVILQKHAGSVQPFLKKSECYPVIVK